MQSIYYIINGQKHHILKRAICFDNTFSVSYLGLLIKLPSIKVKIDNSKFAVTKKANKSHNKGKKQTKKKEN